MKTVSQRRRFGVVVFANRVYGRILREDNGRKVFFHKNQVGRFFREGMRVSFIETESAEFGVHAIDIRSEVPS